MGSCVGPYSYLFPSSPQPRERIYLSWLQHFSFFVLVVVSCPLPGHAAVFLFHVMQLESEPNSFCPRATFLKVLIPTSFGWNWIWPKPKYSLKPRPFRVNMNTSSMAKVHVWPCPNLHLGVQQPTPLSIQIMVHLLQSDEHICYIPPQNFKLTPSHDWSCVVCVVELYSTRPYNEALKSLLQSGIALTAVRLVSVTFRSSV